MKTTKTIMITVVAVALVGFLSGAVRADWDPNSATNPTNHKMHHPQLPDLSSTGMDVRATWPYPNDSPHPFPMGKILADDWKCSQSGPVSDIHIWGSWLGDLLPQNAAGVLDPAAAVGFKLSIHEDIPAGGTVEEHSRPGPELWKDVFEPGDPRVKVRLYEDDIAETFYDPNLNEIIGTDSAVFQYNFFLDPTIGEIFQQEQGTIYWLDVMAILPVEEQAIWGWKTSLDHWNDDAVWGDVFVDITGQPAQWNELRYPAGHPFQGESIDLAFVITPEPATLGVLVIGASLALLRQRRSA